MFHPLAFTKTFAMVGSTILAVTLVPVLCTFLIRGKLHREEDNPLMRVLRAIYQPALAWALRHRAVTVGAAAALFVSAVLVARTIGSEFMPPLDEETALFMPITDPRISLTKATEILRQQDKHHRRRSRRWRWSSARSDARKPPPIRRRSTWRRRPSRFKPKERVAEGTDQGRDPARLDDKLRIPGVTNIWTQPIRNRIDMLSTGIRTQVGVKVFGPDLQVIEQKSEEIERVLRSVPGAADLYAERITGAPYLEINVNRAAAARYGINVADVEDVIETAIGGKNLTTTIEGRQRFPVRVRYARDFREDLHAARQRAGDRQHGRAGAAARTGGHADGDGAVDDQQRKRAAARHRADECARARRRRIRRRGQARGDAERGHAGGLLRRVERPVREPDQRQAAAGAGDPDRAAHHLCAAVPHLPLRERGGARAAGGAVRAHRRRVPGQGAGLQLLGRGVGRIHRAVRHRGADRSGDGDLPRGSGRATHERRTGY